VTLKLTVPEGYEIVETDETVSTMWVSLYPFRWAAVRERNRRNDARDIPSFRYEVERVGKLGRKAWHPWAFWAVVPKQNVLRKRDGA
jgi:hypothetical protein